MKDVIETKLEGWSGLVLNRPAAMNALTTPLLTAVAEALSRLADDRDCRAVVISGAGGNFAAGADIAEIAAKTAADAATDPRKDLWAQIRSFPKPLIAAVDGFALGGGFELALMADMMVLGETARVGLPETNLGLIPGAGGGQRLLALAGRARATRMILTGEIIDAATAEAWGIAAWRVRGSALLEAERIAARIARRAPLALAAAKRALISGGEGALAFAEERAGFEALQDSADKAEGIRAFHEKRKPGFQGR